MKKSPITKYSDNDDNDKDDNMSCVRVWFEFLDGLLRCQNPWYMRGNCDNKEGDRIEHICSLESQNNIREGVTPGSALKIKIRNTRECVLMAYPLQYLALKIVFKLRLFKCQIITYISITWYKFQARVRNSHIIRRGHRT